MGYHDACEAPAILWGCSGEPPDPSRGGPGTPGVPGSTIPGALEAPVPPALSPHLPLSLSLRLHRAEMKPPRLGRTCSTSLSPAPSLPLSVSGCLRICLCGCPCVYLTALDKRPLRPAILRKGLPYGAEMEPPRLPEALWRRPGRRSAAFGDSGGAWGCSGGVSGRSLVAPREASRAFRGAPRTLPETFFELSGEKVHFWQIEPPPTQEHGF